MKLSIFPFLDLQFLEIQMAVLVIAAARRTRHDCAAPRVVSERARWSAPAPDGIRPKPAARLALLTLAVAYAKRGPSASASTSMTVRFSPRVFKRPRRAAR